MLTNCKIMIIGRILKSICHKDSGGIIQARNDSNTIPQQCVSIIDAALGYLTSQDVTGVCRVHREGMTILRKLKKSSSEFPSTYKGPLLASVQMILDICRDIASGPGLSVGQKSELAIIRREMSSTDDLLTDAMTNHVKEMHKDRWEDSDRAYLYLRLLQNLHTAAVCLHKTATPKQTAV